MRVKCKLCTKFISGICSQFNRKRSSGKRRFCQYFDEKKIVRKSVKSLPYVPWKSKADKKKERLRRIREADSLLEKAKLLEQEKSIEVKMKPKIKEQKKGFFKKIFSRVREK